MPLTGRVLLIVCLIFCHSSLQSQDKIYFNNGSTLLCNITDITAKQVTYLPLRETKSKSADAVKILMIFNDRGVFLDPAKMDFTQTKSLDLKRKFLHDKLTLTTSYIFKLDHSVINGDISSQDKNFIYLGNNSEKIDKRSIAAIIYKDGMHEIIGSIRRAEEVLWASFSGDNNAPGNTAVAKSPDNTTSPLIREANLTEPVKGSKEIPVADTDTKKNSVVHMPVVVTDPEAASRALFEERREEFKKKAADKALQFGNYLGRITNRAIPIEQVDKAIDLAVSLFENEEKTVQVSSVNQDSKIYKIRLYLKHLKELPYDKVELLWTNVQYITDIKKDMDGNYTGTITFEQEFKGYKDGELQYNDVTVKKASVILKTYEKTINGRTQELWDVLLGNIGVESTRKL